MTVCIAALSDKGQKVVLVSDQMITANIPIPYQYETDDVSKIYSVTDFSVVMTAGNALFANEIVTSSINRVAATNPTTVQQVADIVREEYVLFRRKIIIRDCLEPRGLDLNSYIANQQRLNIGIVQEIENKLTNFNIGVDIIVAGNNEAECHIFSVLHPGQLISNDAIGYACVGIGAPHALYHLIGSDYKKSQSLTVVEKLATEAKEKSEKAPGVGHQTKKVILPK